MDHMFPVIPRLLCLYQYKLEICDFIVIEKWISVILKAWNSNESNNNAVMMFNVHCRQFSKAINFLSTLVITITPFDTYRNVATIVQNTI